MTTTYAFRFMTKEDYHNYMCGGNDYIMRTDYIKGESKQEAIDKAIALFGNEYEVLTSSFKTEEEVKEEERKATEYKAWINAEEAKEREKRAVREARPGYKTRQKWVRLKHEIYKKEKMIADLMAELEADKARLATLAATYMEETGAEIK